MGENEIKFDTKNYRTHDEKNKKLILKSLKKCGAGRSILIDKQGEIIAGNGVYEQAKNLNIPVKIIETDGSELIAIKRTDLDTESKKRKELALADNSTSDNVTWDLSNLKADFDLSELPEWGLEGLVEVEQLDPEITEDEVPSNEQVETRVKRGDIWKLGEHRLMCGDSTVITDVEKLMGGEKADMVFTDPPYNVNYADKNIFLNNADKGNRIQDDIENDHAGSDETAKNDLWLPAFKNMADNSADDCSIYVTMPQGGAHMMMMMSVQEAGWQVKHELIWVKNNHVLGRVDYLYKHEPILFGWKDKHKFYGKGEHTKSVWEIPKPQKSDLHPTMKPIALIGNALLNSSVEGNNVLDLFGGSGSTLIACEQLNRKCFMMELDEHYCDVIITRWEKLTGKKAERIENANN